MKSRIPKDMSSTSCSDRLPGQRLAATVLGRAGWPHPAARPSLCALEALRGTLGGATMSTPGGAGTHPLELCTFLRARRTGFSHRVGAFGLRPLFVLRCDPIHTTPEIQPRGAFLTATARVGRGLVSPNFTGHGCCVRHNSML